MSVPGYSPGDFWRICDRCGFQKRASQTFKTWDGLYVCEADFEPRHPQDFVRGRVDRQNVPDPRPEPLDNIIGPLQTAISAAATASATTVSVASSVRFGGGDHLGIMLDDGSVKTAIVQSVPSAISLELTAPLGGSVSIGNLVTNYSAVSVADIG
jgi:hypothetical protein